MTKLAVVLSGGGAKGAYEIGAYRALRKLGKRPNIITGTSVGAVNGLLIVQGDLSKAFHLWKNISFSKVYDEEAFEALENDKISDIYKEYVKAFITEGGININKMLRILDGLYDSQKFFDSPIDFGLIAYNYTKNKPVEITKKDLNKDNVKDYVAASASCYPAFKPYKIGDDLYIDGGYYDNMPMNLAIKMGADEIIGIDLRSPGLIRKTKTSIPTTIITPRNKMTSFLVFDKQKSKEALQFGYNDTMKTFGKLDGDVLTFKKGNLVKNYNKYSLEFEDKVQQIINNLDNSVINKITKTSLFQNLVDQKLSYRNFNKLVEKAGLVFGFEETIIYNIKTYNKGLANKVNTIIPISKKIILEKIKKPNFRKLIDNRQIVRYFYDAISKSEYENIYKFIPIFMDDFLIALYIYIVQGKRSTY